MANFIIVMLNFRGDVQGTVLPTTNSLYVEAFRPWKQTNIRQYVYVCAIVLCCLVFCTMEPRIPGPPDSIVKYHLQGRKIMIAANYYNNAGIMAAHTNEMLVLIKALQKAGATPYISIYENGSKDETPTYLRTWKNTLDTNGIESSIFIDSAPSWNDVYNDMKANTSGSNLEDLVSFRIRFMAEIRNKALAPLDKSFDDILFFNDVIFRADDILRLLLTSDMNYDVVCSMDFNRVTFYDTWVSRDVNAERMSSMYPFSADFATANLVSEGRPFLVSSCWNGVVAMKATPFVEHSIKFRTWRQNEPRVLGRPGALMNVVYDLTCPASECLLIFEDLYRAGYSRFYIHPTVHVTYSSLDWVLHSLFGGILNIISLWIFTLHPHGRIPPGHRIPQCGFARDVSLRPWFIICLLCAQGLIAWRAYRWLGKKKVAIE
ncbi:capsular associated protein [Thraustotheca clavata]|uniref:Capsular associated protein n=1 Tax=Thraustotheca clavata TaxID=74557 RepID=A0A1W0A5X1_9STRA|nr:capsular associated protein [Thraustotheca clavata]